MKQVMEAGKVVAAAHAKLLEVSDALADVMEIDRDSVLQQVMPYKMRLDMHLHEDQHFLDHLVLEHYLSSH